MFVVFTNLVNIFELQNQMKYIFFFFVGANKKKI